MQYFQTNRRAATAKPQYFLCRLKLKLQEGFTKNGHTDNKRKSRRKMFFPTCQVRVVRFYVSCFLLVLVLLLPLLVLLLLLLLSSLLLSSSPLLLLPAGLQPRPSTPSVPCRTSTTTIHAQCSLPDLNREYPGPVFPAGPEPRPSTPSVPCRTSTARIHAKCSLPDLM